MFQFQHHLQQAHQIPSVMPPENHAFHNSSSTELFSFMSSLRKKDHFQNGLMEPTSVLDLSAHISPTGSPNVPSSNSISSNTIYAHNTQPNLASQDWASHGRSGDMSSFDDDYTFEWPVTDGKFLLSDFLGQKLIPSSASGHSAHYQLQAQQDSSTLDSGAGPTAYNSSRELNEQVSQQENTSDEKLGLQIVHLLLACVECIQQGNQAAAGMILEHLAACTRSSLQLRSPIERVSGYIAAALRERMNKAALFSEVGSIERSKNMSSSSSSSNSDATDRALYSHFPFLKFAHFTANQAILEAVAGSQRIHIVDLDVGQGLQWPNFIQILASTSRIANSFVQMRLTGVGTDRQALDLTGYRLKEFARTLGVSLDFHGVVADYSIDHLDLASAVSIDDGEVLAVSCSMVLHRMLGNQPALERSLVAIRAWRPVVVTVAEIEANHNAPSFVDRFVEALHFYSAIFDALDVTLARCDPERAAIESHRYGGEIRNILACEGAERIVRHARSDHWRDFMRWSGFKDTVLSHSCLYQAHLLLELYHPPAAYKITRDGSSCILGWHDTPVVSVSSWSCS